MVSHCATVDTLPLVARASKGDDRRQLNGRDLSLSSGVAVEICGDAVDVDVLDALSYSAERNKMGMI